MFACSYSNRSATPGGRRGLQACGLWVRSVFFCTRDRADATDRADTTDRADATDRADVIYYPIEIKAENINEKHATDRADTTDRADATDRADVIFYLSD